ncbi:hypothetical protein HMPREF3038_01861 [Akkermansia sp. KLE1797]|nr:hypothetical protein HMPREF3038_01861 [Akkermansia sp. KLE1797]KXU54757.1 hypothetical protein HMPREF3039_01057 [Akkermansia sp. KLE1798]
MPPHGRCAGRLKGSIPFLNSLVPEKPSHFGEWGVIHFYVG